MDTSQSAGIDAKKNSIDSMNKEELINKYKGLLGIAKQAKKAKDELSEENQKLKDQLANYEIQRDADKKSLLAMQEMHDEFIRNKLEMTSELSELRVKNKSLGEERTNVRNEMEKLSIENEALRRQLTRLTEDNESLLTDIDQMEQQLKQVNVLGIEQKKHLDLLELEVEKLKEYEVTSRKLEKELQDLMQTNKSLEESYSASQSESKGFAAKYQSLKEINAEQRTNFNGLKERFIEVHKKLKQLQECKRILVESHHEYADSISRWQLEIMHASEQLCDHIQSLTNENTELKKEIQAASGDVGIALPQLPVLIDYCEKALVEYRRQNEVIDELRRKNEELKSNVQLGDRAADDAELAKEEENATSKERVERVDNEKTQSDEVDCLRTDNESLRRVVATGEEEVRLLRTEHARLEEEAARVKLRIEEELNVLRTENVKLKEEVTSSSNDEDVSHLNSENMKLQEAAAEAKQAADEAFKQLREENITLREELSRVALNSEEEINRLSVENAKTEEDAVKTKMTADKEVQQLKEENARLEEEVVRIRRISDELKAENEKLHGEVANTKLSEELSHLRTTSAKLEGEAAQTKLKVDQSQAADIESLRKSNQELRDELQAIGSASSSAHCIVLSHLPILIDCCERAAIEHKQQTELVEELRRDLEIKKENDEELKTNGSLTHGTTNPKLETVSQVDLDTLRTENDRLKEELSKTKKTDAEVEEVLKLRENLLANTGICEDLQTKLEKQERENTDLLNEMRELNEALKGRGDVISRQQAKQQELVAEIKKTSTALTKIETDLTAKDTIIKEKELKIAKMSEDNTSALREVNRLQNVSRENESRMKMLSEEIAAMRSQLEGHDTQSDVLSTSTISRAEELARLREVDESFEEKYNKLRSLAVKLKKKAHEQSLCIADLEKQSGDSKTKAAETCEKIATLENEREALQKELKTYKNQVETLKTEVDKLKASKKQSNVLNLEIEAFEKSLNETTAKLTAKTAENDLMRDTLQSKESAIEVMKKEIKILEDSKESEKIHSVELKKQIDKLQAQLKDIIHSKQEISAKLEESEHEKQALQSGLDEIKQRLASVAAEREADRVTLLAEKETLFQRLNSLEDELNTSNDHVALAERSFQDLQYEYSNYKVKAQSVLRQNQTKESSKERELEEELTLVKGEHKELSNRLQKFLEKCQTNEKAIEELQEDNRCLQNRNSELMNTVSVLRQQTEILTQENRKQLETYQEALKGHRLQIEALDSCHLEQMQELHAKHDRTIADLKATHKRDSEAVSQKPLDKIDYILLEREDAEGSEAEAANTPKYLPSARRSTHEMVPLDQLLSSPTVNSTYTVLERSRSISPSIELQETKERLHKQESRVRHLTSLLAESEQDLAKLTQLNEMLKEEVRRQERTVEREKHMHNSEYLKNVVLKFVSLNNGDERTRLVPVLNTILKLSPSETEMLQNVAKGKAADNNNRSWGSYLPHWGSS